MNKTCDVNLYAGVSFDGELYGCGNSQHCKHRQHVMCDLSTPYHLKSSLPENTLTVLFLTKQRGVEDSAQLSKRGREDHPWVEVKLRVRHTGGVSLLSR
jgi:hypothetical protein